MNTKRIRRVVGCVVTQQAASSSTSCSLLGITEDIGSELGTRTVANARCSIAIVCCGRRLRDVVGTWALTNETSLLVVLILGGCRCFTLALLLADAEVGKTSKDTNYGNDDKGNTGRSTCADTT